MHLVNIPQWEDAPEWALHSTGEKEESIRPRVTLKCEKESLSQKGPNFHDKLSF